MRLGYRLPLLIAALFAVLFVAGTWLAYREVRSATTTASAERMHGVADRLAALIESSLVQRRTLLERAASDPAVRAAAAPGGRLDSVAIEAALRPLRGADSLGVVVVLRGDGSALRFGTSRPEVPTPSAEALLGFGGAMALRYSRLLTRPQYSFFWVALPFTAATGEPALLAQLRILTGDASVVEDLIGDEAAVYLANADGNDWIGLGGPAIDAPAGVQLRAEQLRYRRGDREYSAFSQPLMTTPWHLIVEQPADIAHAHARTFLWRIVAVGALLSLLGIAVAVLVTRRMLRPIAELSEATGAIASGAYDRRVDVRGDDEIAQLANSFNAMAAQVELAVSEARHGQLRADDANRAKSAFLATMSHEIRTPINAVVGYAELIELGVAGEPTAEQLAFLERIKLSGRHLTRLVDEILDVARIEAGQLKVVPRLCHAREHLDAAATFVAPQARLRRVSLETSGDDVTFLADPQRVEQILVNLLSNAVKFTDEGGTVIVSCRLAHAPPALGGRSMCCFEVSDTGCGVPADMVEAIFEPFVQADSGYTRKRGGAGLGLSISRELARLMGGAITVSSHVGVGSTFLLWLPLTPVPAQKLVSAGE